MGYRENAISLAILNAIFGGKKPPGNFIGRLIAFFAIFRAALTRFRPNVFEKLRDEVWQLDEEEYMESFRKEKKSGGGLKPAGDLGFSGSTFFTTSNSKFLIKSVPRRFEYTFFADELLEPYAAHMEAHPFSRLVRITDFLSAAQPTLGFLFGGAPSHHVVMENLLYGQPATVLGEEDKWQTYDLKPADYFFPERDAWGALTSQSTKDKLVDKFEDKIRLTKDQRDELLSQLEVDTALLESCNAVDYSLFLIRYPTDGPDVTPIKMRASEWRNGAKSADGKWIYRCVILDFFWAKHKLQAKAMTGLVSSFNIVARKGPMSITTTPEEYRRRFLSMVQSFVSTESEEGS